MIESRWSRTICISVVLAGFLPAPVRAQTFPATDVSTATPARPPADVLNDLTATQDARNLASMQLVTPKDSEAKSAVLDLLRNGPRESKIAVVEALRTTGWSDPDFEQPLLGLLGERDAAVAQAAAGALARYPDDPQVMNSLIAEMRRGRSEGIRLAIIRALGTFAERPAAQELIYLMEHGDSDDIRIAAGDAMIQMTALTDLDHNALQWEQWLQNNQGLSDTAFHDMIMRGRGNAFEGQVGKYNTFRDATQAILQSNFFAAPREKQPGILMGYLQSPSPEIRAIGANVVLASASTAQGVPAGALQQTQALLSDPSPEVRAAAAGALSADDHSAAALVAQLQGEKDDLVRVRILRSLAPWAYGPAIDQMLNLVGPGQSDMVRIAAAEGLSYPNTGQKINSDPKLKQRAIDALTAALKGTDAPAELRLRVAIVGALAVISDAQLSDLFAHLILPNEQPDVRAKALVGLGNQPNPQQYGPQIARVLKGDPSPTVRLAAAEALRHVPPGPLIATMLDRMQNDTDDQVRVKAWSVLYDWASQPTADEADVSVIADGLKFDPAKELVIRQILCNRLSADSQNAALPVDQRKQKAQQLAEQEENMGDLYTQPPVNQPSRAVNYYKSALDYWKANNGGANVIQKLCTGIVRAYLSAKDWDGAANFAAQIVQNNPNLSWVVPQVMQEFQYKASDLAYDDAMRMFDALQKINPPLPQMDTLQLLRERIQQRHAASSRPGA